MNWLFGDGSGDDLMKFQIKFGHSTDDNKYFIK
jgi:hypothetical protein